MWAGQIQLLPTLGQWGTPGQGGCSRAQPSGALWGDPECSRCWIPAILQDSTIHKVPQRPWSESNHQTWDGKGLRGLGTCQVGSQCPGCSILHPCKGQTRGVSLGLHQEQPPILDPGPGQLNSHVQ